ncbi:MAG: hypothetical protein ACREL5_12445 [Gemmatimonadales bacterium]
MPARRPSVAALLLVVLIYGCYGPGWQPYALGKNPQAVDESQVIAFNADGKEYQLHAVRLTKDSISGVPWTEHATCDTCRVAFARAGISNVRTGNPGNGAWSVAGPFLGAVALLAVFASLWCASYGCNGNN